MSAVEASDTYMTMDAEPRLAWDPWRHLEHWRG
jgi:hypothetical protein